MYCKNCGAEIDLDSVFCANCGAKISDETRPKFCVHCGFEVKEDADYCMNCGQEIRTEDQERKKEDYNYAVKFIFGVVVTVLISFLIGVILETF